METNTNSVPSVPNSTASGEFAGHTAGPWSVLAERDALVKERDALRAALLDMLEAYAPYAEQNVQCHDGDESVLHSAVRRARAALRSGRSA